MALSKGKKVLIAIGTIVISIGVVFGAIFGAKNAQEKVNISEGPGTSDSEDKNQGNQGQGEIKPETPDQGETQDPENPDQGETDPENPDQGETQDPEISEAEYYEQNIELLKAALVEDFKNDNKGYDMILDDDTEFIINKAAGEIYFAPKVIMPWGHTQTDFYYIAKLSENFLNLSQKEINNMLNEGKVDYDFSYQNSIKTNLSEEVYNEFAGYLLNQNYDFGEGSVSFSENASVLDISQYIDDGSVYGGAYIQFLVIDGDKVYTARLENAMPPSAYDTDIRELMEYKNSVFKVTEVKDFKEFDYDEQDAQAQASVDVSLDFRGTTFDEFSATEVASHLFDGDPRVSRVHIQYENQDGEEQRGVLVRGGKGGSGENKNTESDKMNNMSMSF